MAFLAKPDAIPIITNSKDIPNEWFLEIKDLNKPEIKNYMDGEFRMKALHTMVNTMVKEEEKKRLNDKGVGR